MVAGAAFFWWLAFFAVGRRRNPKAVFKSWFKPRFIVTVISIFFFVYPNVTDTLLSIYSCARIDTGGEGVPYHAYANADGLYWKLDYDMKCYEKGHLILALVVGIPGQQSFLSEAVGLNPTICKVTLSVIVNLK